MKATIADISELEHLLWQVSAVAQGRGAGTGGTHIPGKKGKWKGAFSQEGALTVLSFPNLPPQAVSQIQIVLGFSLRAGPVWWGPRGRSAGLLRRQLLLVLSGHPLSAIRGHQTREMILTETECSSLAYFSANSENWWRPWAGVSSYCWPKESQEPLIWRFWGVFGVFLLKEKPTLFCKLKKKIGRKQAGIY